MMKDFGKDFGHGFWIAFVCAIILLLPYYVMPESLESIVRFTWSIGIMLFVIKKLGMGDYLGK